MKSLAMGLLASLALIGAARAESPYERLVIVKPEPLVVRAREADRLVADVNRIRDRQGLPEVAVDDLLSRAALLHARDRSRMRPLRSQRG